MKKSDNTTRSNIFDYAVVNGRRMPIEQAQTSIFNEALFYSFGVYETVKVDRGRPFYLEDHLGRLLNSAAMINLNLGVDVSTLAIWFDRLIEVDLQATWGLRILAIGDLPRRDSPIIAMHANPLPTYPDDFYKDGASAVLYQGERALPTCKSLNTLVNYLARSKATQAGALEGLLYHDGHLTEGSRSNLFAVRDGQIITPPEAMVLRGITRDIILQVMQETEYPVVETPVSADLSQYDEFFISSTSMNVMPITQIEGRPIGNGQVGPITKVVMERFKVRYRQVIQQLQPHSTW